ncbi:MAG: autoinducer binding domain-containing protein, partial [Pollutimonas bauzanensis]
MKGWAEDLLTLTSVDSDVDEHGVFGKIEVAARMLGFEHCAYGLRVPLPLTNPKIIMVNNYPSAWQARYAEAGYLGIDPTVRHGRRTNAPLLWSNSVFAGTRQLWAEAQL